MAQEVTMHWHSVPITQWGPTKFFRDNWLSNRTFTGYDDIRTHCCVA